MSLNDFKLTNNFNLSEFECPCCQQVKIGHDLVMQIQALRTKLGIPLTILSGYRCPIHNAQCGGAKESFHMQGRASDITGNISLKQIAKAAHDLGFKGIGIYPEQNFVHIDNRDNPTYWIKHVNKDYQYMSYDAMINY